jgi:hypothetical protein
MSKMDNLRAMREARYEQARARGAQSAPPRPAPVTRSTPEPTAQVPDDLAAADPTEALCGHRAISGRTCTREAGHSAKSHRYS